MEQSLSMKPGQRLSMTMQMQQAIQILQMSTQELRETALREYLENPALELDETGSDGESLEAADAILFAEDPDADSSEYPVSERKQGMGAASALEGPSLADELLEQASFAFSDKREREIAAFLAGSIDERGYLMMPVPDIARALSAQESTVRKVLQRIQEFEPSGVGARNLQECLRIQARQRGIYEGLVAAIIDRHLDAVAESRIRGIAEAERARVEDVRMAVDILRTLNPKPGNAYGTGMSQCISPDVLVAKVDGAYVVSLQDKGLPRLRMSSLYRNTADFDERTRNYIRQRIHAAAWLIRSIEQRRETICHVMEEIVRQQRPCMDFGMAHLRPMTMKQVADSIGVHESTVSRAAANKYAGLPWGVVPIRKFFAAGLGNALSGEVFIAGRAKAALGELIGGEDANKPLSDQKLAELLAERGMQLSRRTVMKYREQLGYPSSVKRKQGTVAK